MASKLGNSRASLVSWNKFNEANGNMYYGELDQPIMRAYRIAYDQALSDAADEIQALHPGEVKNSVTFLRRKSCSW